jgi:DNA-directed RNA polymerase sigma subunit (sigma70/sigma32)
VVRRDNWIMTGSLSWITDDSWPSDEGWPYPDHDADIGADQLEELVDVTSDTDDDLVSLHAASPRLLDDLAPVERAVITARYGLDGGEPRTIRQIQHDLGVPRADLRVALGDGLAKLRHRVG